MSNSDLDPRRLDLFLNARIPLRNNINNLFFYGGLEVKPIYKLYNLRRFWFISKRPQSWHVVMSGRFYQILNLNLFMPIYHYLDTFTAAAYVVY